MADAIVVSRFAALGAQLNRVLPILSLLLLSGVVVLID